MITAPYNFVPLNEKVYIPYWSNLVSHDIPFKDGESGEIDITITAKSPIFIKDSKNKEDFCNHNGQYYIPGSSVKGMIRNVLEIMSFSKLNKNQYNDDTYSVRDMSNSKNFYMSKMKPNNTYCGWLKKIGNDYFIEDCSIPGRIKHEEIDKIFNIDFASKFKKKNFGNKADDKTALKKYEILGNRNLIHNFSYVKDDVGRKIYRYDKNGQKKGTLVLTGQPSGRDESKKIPSGKIYEFVFFDSKEDILLSEDVVENFKFAYFDERNTQPEESPDWKYWKEKLNNCEKIPVFFQKDKNVIVHFGLSYLYKLPYKNSIKDGISLIHSDEKLDLSQTIFGYIDKDKKEALKGRVQFSHFKALENINVLDKRTEVLGTPRASYYPIYIKQESKEFKTYMNDNFSIAGRKKYPIHKGSKVMTTSSKDNEKVGSTFIPLKEGVVFHGKLRYHNLKKCELGALLSSLTLHNTSNTFHNIGMGKSLGYGKIEFKINSDLDLNSYLKEFELNITEEIDNWIETIQIKELLSMSIEQDNKGNSELKYLELDPSKNIDEFSKNKVGDNRDFLRSYTLLENIISCKVKSLISNDDMEDLKNRRLENEKKQKELNEFNSLKNSQNIDLLNSFLNKYPETIFKEDIVILINEIKENEEKQKLFEYQKEIEEKWNAVLNVDIKYKQKALEDFITNYPNADKIELAKKELENHSLNSKKSSNTNLDDLKNAKDGKKVKLILEKLGDLSDTQNLEILEILKTIYLNMKSKDQKNFFKDAQLGRFLGSDIENKLKNDLN